MEDFEQFIPGIGEVVCTPVGGLWVDGVLTEKMACSPSRAIVARTLGIDPEYIEDRVEDMMGGLLHRIRKILRSRK
jgi:hypothetical protein